MRSEPDFATWLLNSEIPSLRYQTLTDLLGYPATDPRVAQARQAIMQSGPVPAILAHQAQTGQWQGERSHYTPKYVSTHWSLMLLTELGVDGGDARFLRGVRHMLDITAGDLGKRLETRHLGFSCFWGNLLRYTLQAGLIEGDAVEKVVHYAALDLQERSCRCVHNGGYACAWGVVRTLWGLAAIPKTRRTREINRAITSGVTFTLDSFNLLEANYPTPDNGDINPLWFKLNFPLFYQVDILFVLRVLAELDALDHPGAQPALEWLEQRQGQNGRCRGASPFRRRTWPELGDREETERWVSLQASRILRQAGRLSVSDT